MMSVRIFENIFPLMVLNGHGYRWHGGLSVMTFTYPIGSKFLCVGSLKKGLWDVVVLSPRGEVVHTTGTMFKEIL